MSFDFGKDLKEELAVQILKVVSTGLALFSPKDFTLKWCNPIFKKQTWFGGAGKSALKVTIEDLFEKKDHKLINDMFGIALSLGQAYDFQRSVRRGPIGSFPAEIKFYRINLPNSEVLVCLEISDLSLTKMYDELQSTHAQVREKMAELMATQAELHHSVRMNTISEVGSDVAHQLINPITMCRDLLTTQICPTLTDQNTKEDMKKVLHYMQDILDLAVWFRKFSNPKLAEVQSVKVVDLVNDALMLNVHRFTTQGIVCTVRRDESYAPQILSNPVNFIMWLNAVFTELANVIVETNKSIYIDVNGSDDCVIVSVQCLAKSGSKKVINVSSLENVAHKMPGNPNFESIVQENHVHFSLAINCLKGDFLSKENEKNQVDDDFAGDLALQQSHGNPLVLVVDDEQDIRKLVKRALKQSGWESVEAEDGLQALEYFHDEAKKDIAQRIQVIVCDVRMPKMTGPHFLVAIREENIQIPFVFFSSNLVDNGENGFKYENIYYLTKESGLEELKKIVAKYMK